MRREHCQGYMFTLLGWKLHTSKGLFSRRIA